MLITLDDVRIAFNPQYDNNGIIIKNDFTKIFNHLQKYYNYDENVDFGLISVEVESEQMMPFASSKSISTTQAMYKDQNIITAINEEPITFTLTLVPVLDPLGEKIPVPWTNEMWTELYSILDVRDYKPLIFGNPNRRLFTPTNVIIPFTADKTDYVSRPYYNCIPLVNSVSELKLFVNSQGYVSIPFQCDCGHMWIDVQKTYSRKDTNTATNGWFFPNYSNVKDYTKQAMVYPIINISNFISNSEEQKRGYISFTNANVGKPWFEMTDFIVSNTLSNIIIDNYNKQIYGFDIIDNQKILNNNNYIKCLSPIRFFQLPQENRRKISNLCSGNQVWHRTLVNAGNTSYYDIQFFYSCPYMGGNEDDDEQYNNNKSVMGYYDNSTKEEKILKCKQEIKDTLKKYKMDGILVFGNDDAFDKSFNNICSEIDKAVNNDYLSIAIYANSEHTEFYYIAININNSKYVLPYPIKEEKGDDKTLTYDLQSNPSKVIRLSSGNFTSDENELTSPATLFYCKTLTLHNAPVLYLYDSISLDTEIQSAVDLMDWTQEQKNSNKERVYTLLSINSDYGYNLLSGYYPYIVVFINNARNKADNTPYEPVLTIVGTTYGYYKIGEANFISTLAVNLFSDGTIQKGVPTAKRIEESGFDTYDYEHICYTNT